jgi:acyl-CoA synthetase (AMP-forming)/AMP-acid ligase II
MVPVSRAILDTPPAAGSGLGFASHLSLMARVQPHALAALAPDGRDPRGRARHTHYTFAQLEAETQRIAQALRSVGIGPGVRTVFMIKPGLEFLAFAFALFRIGAVLVGIDPAMGPRNIARCLAEVKPSAFIGLPIAHFFRRIFGWSRSTIRTNVVVGSKAWTIDHILQAKPDGCDASGGTPIGDTPAAIVFTSGSTGVPKGVIYTHDTFHAQVAALRQLYGIERGEIDLATFAHFSFFTLALGLTTVFADMDFLHPARACPATLAAAIDDFGVTNLFGSPALLNVLGRWTSERCTRFPSLRRIISAGAPVPAAVMRRLQDTLNPGVEVFTPYGATEALPVTSIGSTEILVDAARLTAEGKGVCVGRPCAGIELRIIRITDGPLQQWSDHLEVDRGQIGEIAVRGPGVTASYYNRPEANALAKIQSPGGLFHRMGDLGYLDEQGRVWFCGRKSQRVTAPTGVYFTVPCEGVFNAHPKVFRSALVPLTVGGAIQPGLCVQTEPGVGLAEQRHIRGEFLRMAARYPHTSAIERFFFFRDFPVDPRHNAKIGREKLAAMAQRKLS